MAPLRAVIPIVSTLIALLTFAAACQPHNGAGGPRTLRFGHFPNVTHVHGLVAHRMAVEGHGWFEARLGEGVKVEWFVYNAGPSAMEGLLAGTLDLTYVGPSPAINAYVKCKGTNVRVLAGATRGGAALVVRGDGSLTRAEDFRGKRVATPQLGNSQDVACRDWLVKHGLRVTQTGGDVAVVPTQNSDQLDLFKRGELDAAWTVEPWVSRLELEAGGKILLEETDAITTILTGHVRLVEKEPGLAAAIVKAHQELTAWIAANPAEAKRLVKEEIRRETTRAISDAVLTRCWPRLRLRDDVATRELEEFVRAAKEAGFLRQARDLSTLIAEVR